MMGSSVFKRLLTTYLGIIVSAIAALSLILSFMYSKSVFDEKHSSLLSAAVKVNQLATDYSLGNITKESFDSAMDSLGYVTGSKIYLVRADEEYLDSDNVSKISEELMDSYLVGDLRKIIAGQEVYRKNQYSDLVDMNVVFTGVPWKSGTQINGAILLFAPIDNMAQKITSINLVIWLTGLFFMLLSAVIILFSSRRISKPIKRMEQAASKIASGEEAEDIPIKSRDEIGKLAQAFNYMKHQLAGTERMRREFIANVSHELRTPLTSLGGFIEGMRDGLIKPENYRRYLDAMHEEVARLTRLTNDILQLAKVQSGSLALNREELSVREVIRAAVTAVGPLTESKNIAVAVNCDAGLFVYADHDKLQQIFVNLLGNSVKYGREGGNITVSAEKTAKGVCFLVADDGIGISPEELPNVFDKFYRAAQPEAAAQGGTGLGLSIVKNLAELHGGRVTARSEAGRGTTMEVFLPDKSPKRG